jgi:hypothetical protein
LVVGLFVRRAYVWFVGMDNVDSTGSPSLAEDLEGNDAALAVAHPLAAVVVAVAAAPVNVELDLSSEEEEEEEEEDDVVVGDKTKAKELKKKKEKEKKKEKRKLGVDRARAKLLPAKDHAYQAFYRVVGQKICTARPRRTGLSSTASWTWSSQCTTRSPSSRRARASSGLCPTRQ